jgi:SAM-dependent methyltransferase/alpha-beta hydrolase superfamily lysophospholipase
MSSLWPITRSSPRQGSHQEGDPFSFSERRDSSRLAVNIPATLVYPGGSLAGTMLDISFGGSYIIILGSFPASENNPIHVGFVSHSGIFPINARVRGIRTATEQSTSRWLTGLAVEFEPLTTKHQRILASLVDGIRDGDISCAVTVSLRSRDSSEFLLEVKSGHMQQVSVGLMEGASLQDRTKLDRRLAARILMNTAALLRPSNGAASDHSIRAAVVNIGIGGACVRVPGQMQLFQKPLTLSIMAPEEMSGQSHTYASKYNLTLQVEVVWSTSDAFNSPVEFPSVGLRFRYVDDDNRRRMSQLIRTLLTRRSSIPDDQPIDTPITSVLLECQNRRNEQIRLYYDYVLGVEKAGSPLAIVSPAYVETKKESIALGYYLAKNGFHVLRYDYTHHVGESDGDIESTTLTSMMDDLHAVIKRAKSDWPDSPLILISSSLGGRVALKAVTEDATVSLLVLLAPVVDVQATLLAVHQENLVGTYNQGLRRGVINVLGVNVDSDRWLDDAVNQGYADLNSTLADAQAIRTSVIVFSAEHDAWVTQDSINAVQRALGIHCLHSYIIPGALHRVSENPKKMRGICKHVVCCCLETLPSSFLRKEIQHPSSREIACQRRIERDRAKAHHHIPRSESRRFWDDYLKNFVYIPNVPDFWKLLDHLYGALGSIGNEERILDAGCGNGTFGALLLINQAYRHHNFPSDHFKPVHYVGVDFVPSAIAQAQAQLKSLMARISQSKLAPSDHSTPLLTSSFGMADLNVPLPFKDNAFDKIVCNLVIGYLDDPLFSLRELRRLLSPHGRIILTNLKPHADLSEIYRNFLKLTDTPEELAEGRRLLQNSGKITTGECEGLFRFFEEHELMILLRETGFMHPRIYLTFGNQAYLAVAEQPSTGDRTLNE